MTPPPPPAELWFEPAALVVPALMQEATWRGWALALLKV